MPKKTNNNKEMTQKVDKNRPKSKQEKKEEQKKHKMAKNEKAQLAKKGFESGNSRGNNNSSSSGD